MSDPRFVSTSSLTVLLWMALCCFSSVVQAQPVIVSCDLLLRDKLYRKAYRCFLDKTKQTLQHKKKISKLRKVRVGLQAQQAASAAEQLAKQSKTLYQKTYWWEQAIKVMRLSYRNKLCVRAYRCRQLLGKITELQQKIGYGRLTVRLPVGIKVRVRLKGYRLKRRSGWIHGRWIVKRLRPGPYMLYVQTQTGQNKRCQTLVKQREERTIRCYPNKQQRPSGPSIVTPPQEPTYPYRTAGWAMTIAGAAAVVTGVIVLVVGQGALTLRDEKAKELKSRGDAATSTDLKTLAQDASQRLIPEINSLHEQGQTQIILGWIITALGAASLGTGVVLMVKQKSPAVTNDQKN